MEFLIDRKFWQNVIEEANPSMAKAIKEGLKKDLNTFTPYEFKRECILILPNKEIYYGFCDDLLENRRWRERLRKSLRKNSSPLKEFIDFEKLILGVLIKTQGLPKGVKYYINQKGEYIIDQEENHKLISFNCWNCGASIFKDQIKCDYCGNKLVDSGSKLDE